MKILIPSEGPSLSDSVSSHFGRAKYLLLVDPELDELTVFDNRAVSQSEHCAGIQTAGTALELGAETIVSQNIGPEALKELAAAKIPVFLAAAGTVEQAVEDFASGRLQRTFKPTLQAHHVDHEDTDTPK